MSFRCFGAPNSSPAIMSTDYTDGGIYALWGWLMQRGMARSHGKLALLKNGQVRSRYDLTVVKLFHFIDEFLVRSSPEQLVIKN